MSDKIFVLTLNWNGQEFILDCLESIKNLNFPVNQLVVVDNASSDDSVEIIKSKFPDIKIIENKLNLGYSRGFNKGIEFSIANGADFILIMNNDTVIDKNALGELVKTIKTDEKIGFVSGKVLEHNYPNIIQTVGRKKDFIYLISETHIGAGEEDIGQYDNIAEYDYIDDVFLLVRKEVINEVGGYDDSFFLYYEETDWCSRVRKAGFRIVCNPSAKIWHKGSLSTGGGMNSVKRYWLSRNQYLFIMRNGNKFQRFYFTIRNILVTLPTLIISYSIKGRIDLLFSLIKGNVSGLIWTLKN